MGEVDGAEGFLSSEAPEAEEAAPTGADAVAVSLAMQQASGDPALSRAASAYLDEQRQLVRMQIHHFDEERRLGIAAAKRKRYADRIRNGLYTGIALLVLALLVGAARMTYEALSDHGLVVEDFTVPVDFAARGVTSQALAEDLANRVAAVRAAANLHSLTYSNEVRAEQDSALKVQIPETGISIDELERFLHRWLGHQTVVNAELREEEENGRISLVLHIGGTDPIIVTGSAPDLDSLMQTAAEKAFAAFDPTNHIVYLIGTGRRAEAYDAALRFLHSAALTTQDPESQAGDYSLLAASDPDTRRALDEQLLAIDADPASLATWQTTPRISLALGHDQAALEFARRILKTKQKDQPDSQRNAYPWLIALQGKRVIDQALGDFTALRGDYEVADQRPNVQLVTRYAERALVAALLHDEATARHNLRLALTAGPEDSALLQDRWDLSTGTGDWVQALEAAKALVAAGENQKLEAEKSPVQRPEFAAPLELALQTQYRPQLALAEAMTGDTAAATALISQTPTDCYLCVRTRARVAAAAGDAATADRWFAESVHQAPDLPAAYYEWGEALLARGDLAGAARELSLAHEKGPHWADPLKAWGDVLVKQGHPEQAMAKYDEALRDAPNWAALKQARESAGSTHHG